MSTSDVPLVSILVPCWNAAAWLPATLQSALDQTWPHKEIIVVNDGSTDDSLAVARRFEAHGVTVLDQRNSGASSARNTALKASKGAWLQFLDADDLLAQDKIERQMSLADKTGPEFALCGGWTRFRESLRDADFTPQPLSVDAPPVDWLLVKFEQNRMMHPAAWLVSRSLATLVGPWDEALSLDDDGEYFTRVVLASRGVRCAPEAISYYRSGVTGSLSGAKSERALASAWRSLELSIERLLQAEDSPRTRHACATVAQRFIFDAYPRARECRHRAAAWVTKLGGSTLEPEGGPKFQLARRFLGWRLARRLQQG